MKRPLHILLLGLALLKFVLPFLLQDPSYEPHRDELLYIAEGRHMAWGYMEVPPLLSVFAFLALKMGGGMFWLKFWPSLIGAFTLWVTGQLMLTLGAKSFALVVAFLCFACTGYLRVHFLFQPNGPEILAWTCMCYCIIRHVQTQKDSWLLLFGLATGLGMLSKYSVAIFLVALLLGLAMTPYRKVFMNRSFWLAGAIASMIFLPNLVWQARHHFPVLQHMKELRKTQLQYLSPITFLLGQLVMLMPCTYVWLLGCWKTAAGKDTHPYRFIAWTYGFVLLLLLLGSGKDYYALGIYPTLIAFGSWYLERLTQRRRWLWRPALVLATIALSFYMIPIALPIWPPQTLADFYQKHHLEKMGVLRWEDQQNHPLPQDFSDMLGWEEMTQKMARAYQMLSPEEKKDAILFCDNYGLAGAVNFYGAKYGLPEAYSDNASFLYWLPAGLNPRHIVLLTDDPKDMTYSFVKDFDSAQLIDSVTSPFARERGDLIILLRGAHPEFRKYYSQKLEKKRAEWHASP